MKGIVRILDEKGQSIGTGFYISRQGDIITCHHVVAGQPVILIQEGAGEPVTGQLDDSLSVPEYDLAFIRTGSLSAHTLKICLDYEVGDKVSASGYQFQDDNIVEAYPTLGEISGNTLIRFGELTMPVITIQQATIDHGISGGPLKSLPSGSAIGVVSMKILDNGGGAIAFKDAADRNEKLRSYLESIEEPAFGASLNYPGAISIVRDHTQQMLQLFRETLRYLPDRFVPREGSDLFLERFLEPETTVLALTGASGAGKTNLVASLAEELGREHPVLLIPFYKLQLNAGFRKAIYEHVKLSHRSPLPPEEKFGILFDKITAKGKRAILILEGINETQTSESIVIDNFFEDLRLFTEQHQIKLIVSSRPEFFARVRPHLIPSQQPVPDTNPEATSRSYTAELQNYTEPELKIALKRYGIGSRLLHHHLLSHPFYLRLAWETAGPNSQAYPSAISLIKHYLEARFAAVDRLLNRAPQAQYYFTKMDLLGASMALRDDLTISHQEIYAAFTPGELQHLISEAIFVQEEAGSRFNFDIIAEYFIARTLRAEAFTDANARAYSNLQSQACHFFVALHENDQVLTGNILWRLSELKDISAFKRSLSGLTRPEVHEALLLQAVKRVCNVRPSNADSYHYYRNRLHCIDIARYLPMRHETRSTLIRILAQDENLEREVQIHQSAEGFRQSYNFALAERNFYELIDYATAQDPTLLCAFVRWCDSEDKDEYFNTERPRTAGAHLAPFIYHFRNRNFTGILDELYHSNFYPDWLTGIFIHDSHRLFSYLQNLHPSTPEQEKFVLQVCQFYINTRHNQHVMGTINAIFTSSASEASKAMALDLLLRAKPASEDAYNVMIREIKGGNEQIGLSTIFHFLERHPDEVLGILEKLAYRKWIGFDVLRYFNNYEVTGNTSVVVSEFFIRLYQKGYCYTERAGDFLHALSKQLELCPPHFRGFGPMFELAITLLEDPSVKDGHLLRFFTNFRNDTFELLWMKLAFAVPYFEEKARLPESVKKKHSFDRCFRDIIVTSHAEIALPFALVFCRLMDHETFCKTIFYTSQDSGFYWELKRLLAGHPDHEIFVAVPLLAKAIKKEIVLHIDEEYGRLEIDPERHLKKEDPSRVF